MPALNQSWQTANLSYRSLLWLVASASLLLSLWGAYAQFIPNPDSMYYLRSAELFAAGRWRDGLEIFRWPLYSLGIASVVAVTGASALVAAQVLNAVLNAATAVLFVALVARLANGDRPIALWAAFFILLHPKLTQLRPVIIRDHGFYTFLVLSLYLVILDLRSPRISFKIGITGAVGIAALFRPEAAILFLLIPAFYLFNAASSRAVRWAIVAAVMFVCALLVPAYSLWNFMGSHSAASTVEMFDVWSRLTRDVFRNMLGVSEQLEAMLPRGRNVGGLAYAGIVLAITIDVVLRALTIPIAVLVVLAYLPRRVLPTFASSFIGWFAWWQLPLLFTFMTFALFLDWRYAMAFALLAGIPAIFTLDAAAQDAVSGTWRQKTLLAAAVALVVVPFALAVPRFSNLAYLRDAGNWIRESLPANAQVLTNDARIAYYSGRAYDRQIKVLPTSRFSEGLNTAEYLVVNVERGVPPTIQGVDQTKQAVHFSGGSDRRVIVYRLR